MLLYKGVNELTYTGTGTENDPYCVSNLTDLTECIKQTGSYVKVIADIDAAEDASYTGELTSSLEIACKQIYADEPKKIKGITVYATNFILFKAGSQTHIENLSFVDCTHKRTSSSATIYATSGTYTFKNCKFSMKLVGYYGIFASSQLNFTNCAGSLIYTATTSHSSFSAASFTNCNFVIENLHVNCGSDVTTGTIKKTGIIFLNSIITLDAKNILNFGTKPNEYCYMVFVNPQISSDSSIIISQKSTKTNTFLVALQDVSEDITITVDASTLTEVIPEQLKDRDYLTSIGFFP